MSELHPPTLVRMEPPTLPAAVPAPPRAEYPAPFPAPVRSSQMPAPRRRPGLCTRLLGRLRRRS